MKKILVLLKGALLTKLLPMPVLSSVPDPSESETLHYNILKNTSLKEIARKKLHHGDGIYLNPLGKPRRRRLSQLLRWKLFSESDYKKNYKNEKVQPVHINWEPVKKHTGLSITYIKHSTILIKDRDQYLIVDPVFYDIFWFIKDYTPLAFNLDAMPKPNQVLITHGHYDHLNIDSLEYLGNKPHVITPLGYNKIFKRLKHNNRTQLDWYDSYKAGQTEITLLPCNHWTMRNPITGPNHSLWGSYMIKTADGHHIYVSGDTAYFDGFEEIGKSFPIDLAIINLSAYEPRWFMAQSHINPKETVQAFKQLNAKNLMITHWGSFRLGDEPVYLPPLEIKQEMKKEGIENSLLHLNHGDTHYLA